MRTRSWQAFVAAAIALAVDVLYVVIIWQEGEGELASGRVLFVASCLVWAAIALVLGVLSGTKAKAGLFAGAAALLLVWTVLGAFSIGLLLAPAAALAALASLEVLDGARAQAALGALAAIAVVTFGLLLT